MNEPNDSSHAARRRLVVADRARHKRARLVWAITIGEAILVGAAAIALLHYWMMLPVLMRSGGAALLGALALFGIYRVVKFYRRAARLKKAAADVEEQRLELNGAVSGLPGAPLERDGLAGRPDRPAIRRCSAVPETVTRNSDLLFLVF
jgi:hypothetical protein